MAKKFGLGKGLGALIPEDNIKEEKKEKGGIINIELKDIKANKKQPRKFFDNNKLNELAESVKEHGIIQPLILKKEEKGYSIIAGERRYRAAKIAELTEVPALIMDISDEKLLQVSLIENIQREDLNPIEKATAIRELLDKYNLTQQKLADKLGISRSGLANTVRILNLQPEVIELVKEGKLTEGHCKALLGIEDPEKQYQAAKYIIENGETVRDVEKQAKIKKKANSTVKNRYEPIYRDIEDSFRSFFGTKVKIDAKQRSGKIIIQYSSNEDLERILGLVK